MTWLEWLRGLLGQSELPFESQVYKTDVWSEEHLIGLINVERVKHGLRPVAIDPALTAVAMHWNATQARLNRGVYDHGDFRGRIAEVIAAPAGEVGSVGDATMEGTVAGWMASEGHRAQILTPHYVVAGASRALASDRTTYTGCDFAARPTWPKRVEKIKGGG